MPSAEFWISGASLFGIAVFVYTLVIAVMGVNQTGSRGYKLAVWAILPLVAWQWWTLAKQEENNTKPQRDYAYFVPSPDPRMARPDGVVLFTQSTGVIRDIHYAFERTEDYVSHHDNYVSFGTISIIDEDLNNSGFVLPPGDWNIDIDPPTKLGKIRERMIIVRTGPMTFDTKIWVDRTRRPRTTSSGPGSSAYLSKSVGGLLHRCVFCVCCLSGLGFIAMIAENASDQTG